jgi:hypothetical protein
MWTSQDQTINSLTGCETTAQKVQIRRNKSLLSTVLAAFMVVVVPALVDPVGTEQYAAA